ncbi:hypothetical protein SLEP1_g41398 [Rubroshorea leprosula]|uniref:BZIP domain-containing protein n=1 Tax=Rubroshorea leprosula TaxID=152421 RepID=A0AAV5L715_9ROSI|nr:hypothetical protein SLEP1_g41398 [Rubroshorea leprosula]
MENSTNINFSEGGEDEENRQCINGSSTNIGRYLQNEELSIGAQNLLWTNRIAVQTETMRQERQPADISSADSTEQNGPVNNQMATDAGKIRQQHSGQCQRQRTATPISPADSYSRRNTNRVTTADPRARKKRNDKAYRDRVKEKQQRMESNLETLKAENDTLIKQNTLVNQRFETQSKELDGLNQNFIKQLENQHKMKFDLERLETENGELKRENKSLKRDNVLANEKFETQSKQLGKLEHKYKKQHERKRQLKSNLKTLEVEKGRLKNEIIELLKKERVAGYSTNFIGRFGHCPNVETEASPQVVPSLTSEL